MLLKRDIIGDGINTDLQIFFGDIKQENNYGKNIRFYCPRTKMVMMGDFAMVYWLGPYWHGHDYRGFFFVKNRVQGVGIKTKHKPYYLNNEYNYKSYSYTLRNYIPIF